jgi:hypothetical protein
MDPIGIIIRKIIIIVDWLSKSALVGVILGFFLRYLLERIEKAKLKVMEEPKEEPFRSSKRIVFRVRHVGGSLPATNAICYLDVSANEPLSKFLIPKDNGCILGLCKKCEYTYYLVSREEKEIKSEPLPWSISIPAGFGLQKLPYRHVTNIPVGGEVKINLFDIYKYIDASKNEKFYLIKVHSEYGEIKYPRACIKLPIDNETQISNVKISFKLRLAAENLKDFISLSLEIEKEGSEYVIYISTIIPNIIRRILEKAVNTIKKILGKQVSERKRWKTLEELTKEIDWMERVKNFSS